MTRLALLASLFIASTASASPHWWRVGERDVANRDHRMIDVGDRAFRTLRFEAVAGEPRITGIGMRYADGTTKFVRLNRPDDLERHPRDLVLNRGLRRINAIVVYTDPSSPGRYAIYGT